MADEKGGGWAKDVGVGVEGGMATHSDISSTEELWA